MGDELPPTGAVRGGVYSFATDGRYRIWKVIEVEDGTVYATTYSEVLESPPEGLRTTQPTPSVVSTPLAEEAFLPATLLAVESVTETERATYVKQLELQSQWFGP